MLRLNIMLMFLCLFVLGCYSQKIYVVSVGIADYKEIRDLSLTENDVRVFNELMYSQGAEVTTLLGAQATHAQVISSIRSSFARAGKEDTMIFFFSGHGYEGGFPGFVNAPPKLRFAVRKVKKWLYGKVLLCQEESFCKERTVFG